MTNEQNEHIREAELRRKEPQEKCLCYVSFAAGGEWLGGAYVELDYWEHRYPKARMAELGLNPGGEALCIPVPLGRQPIDRMWWNRLIVDPKELAEAVQARSPAWRIATRGSRTARRALRSASRTGRSAAFARSATGRTRARRTEEWLDTSDELELPTDRRRSWCTGVKEAGDRATAGARVVPAGRAGDQRRDGWVPVL
jgi:hypothetical protein